MELSRNSVDNTRKRKVLGRCRHFFWLGIVFDTVGATVLLTGVFADLPYCDLLLYAGSIIIFISLLWWVSWYTSNIELTPEGALKRPFHVPSAAMADALSQTVDQRFSFRLCNVPDTFRQIWPGWHRRRLLQSNALGMTVSGQVEKQPAKEDQDDGIIQVVKKKSDSEDLSSEHLGPKAEAIQSSEGGCAPGPESGSPCCVLRFVEGPSTHLVRPEFTSSPLDQPLPPANFTSVVPFAPTSQPLTSLTSKGVPVVSLASTSRPPAIPATTSLTAVPLSPAGQPLDTLASQSQTTAMVASRDHSPVLVASQSHSLVSVAAQSHLPVASERNFQHLSPASQTQPQPAQVSQTLATPVTLIQLLSAPSFQTQPVDLRVTSAVQDIQALCDTQQAPQSSALVQEIALSQSSSAQESLKKPVAQAFKTVPPTGQELSQEVPDTMSPLPESPAAATGAQQSVSPEGASTPTSAKNSHPL
ncbi:uncharacterized protein RBU33_013941 isoform 1-T2 [Hipposideros larvatus]